MAQDNLFADADTLKTETQTIEAEDDTAKEALARFGMVSATHDFCLFMQDIYTPEDAVLIPPEGDCPKITRKSFWRSGKSDRVIEVLQHMTYTRWHRVGDPYEVLRNTGSWDYRQQPCGQKYPRKARQLDSSGN